MRRLTRTAVAVAAAATLIVGLTGCNAITSLISGEDDVYSLGVGDCFDSNESTESGSEIESVPTVDCDKPHDFEVYSSLIMDDESYPGDAATQDIADEQCLASWDAFLGATYEEAVANDYTYFYPTESSWGLGDREVLCMIVSLTAEGEIEKVTGTLKGAGAGA
jgi:hypothetical protein